jgi:hypothetical protein
VGEVKVYTDFKFDGGGVAVLGDYYPGVLLERWYEASTDLQLVAEIKSFGEQIKANRLCFAPAQEISFAFVCRPLPTSTP